MGEFDLIERYFKRPGTRAALGVGDDCALLQATPGMQLAVTSDMLVSGRHFLPGVDPLLLGHKALAVNLSDLAACGARPLAFTLALALPAPDPAWLEGFSRGLFRLADEHGCELVGGDTTQGPLNVCITAFGETPVHDGRIQALLRRSARPGDDLYVSGQVGDAHLALDLLLGRRPAQGDLLARVRTRLERPTPRVALGQALRGVANAAIDISDGLLGDLGHILKASGVGARVESAWVMASDATSADLKATGTEYARRAALAGGDDYELLFSAQKSARAAVQAAARSSATTATLIGSIEAEPGLRLLDPQGRLLANDFLSFDHFA
jgi:thiamine-monophosphate kinase